MREEFAQLKPEKVIEFFYDISQIPRGSGNEDKISEYLESFAKDRALFCIKYKNNNILIRKPASPGKEDVPGVILQSHMDMVCEKNNDTDFDFDKEPLNIYIDEDFVKAKGTTLGADNGIGVAMTLAVLDSKEIAHPQVEAIFTVDEERGLTGAMEFDVSEITGKTLINLDSEEDDEILTSCAGGVRINHSFKYKKIKRPKDTVCADILLTGLQGGHSGMDIAKGRANANRLLGRVLFAASREMEMNLVEISGGSKDNAIPREASCRITLEKAEKENLELIVKEHQRYFAKEFKGPESSIKLDIKHVDSKCDKVIDDESTNKIISAILLIPNGVISMSNEIENMPVSSANIGVIETKDDEVVISIAARSSVASKKEEIISINRALSSQFETHISFHGDYPGWSYAEESPLRDTAQRVYKELFNQEAKIVAVHAGVECGIFGEKIPGLDMISIGPNIFDVHSPDERLSISSTEKTWKFLTELLEEIK